MKTLSAVAGSKVVKLLGAYMQCVVVVVYGAVYGAVVGSKVVKLLGALNPPLSNGLL